MAKRRTTKRKTTTKRKSTTTRARTRKRVQKQPEFDAGYGWELVPFVVAIVVAIIVVVQSLDSAKHYQKRVTGPSFTISRPSPTHMAAGGCELTGAPLRELKAAERALQRTVEGLDEAEALYQWECATRANDPDCILAKSDLRGVNRQVQLKIQEVQQMRVQACL